MNELRKAAEMSLEFVEWLCGDDHSVRPKNKALEVREELRQALAEPEQEPVAPPDVSNVVLAAVLAEREACAKVCEEIGQRNYIHADNAERCAVAIRARGDAVNMSQERVDETAKREHEPVAWLQTIFGPGGHVYYRLVHDSEMKDTDKSNYTPLYTAPPKREWVGLTGLEQKELMAMNSRYAVFETEAKLKEKNS